LHSPFPPPQIGAPIDLVRQTKSLGRLPVVNFAAGGVATPADAALMMQLGCDGVFVGSGIFKSGDPAKRARAIVQAVTHYNDPKVLAEVSCDLGEPMVGLECKGPNFVACACPATHRAHACMHGCTDSRVFTLTLRRCHPPPRLSKTQLTLRHLA
jgi:tRNA-dihydrouridine synthase